MLAIPTILLGLTAFAAAVPTPAPAPFFSMEQWVEDLITSPDTALSVEDATAAYLAGLKGQSDVKLRARSDSGPLIAAATAHELGKRQACWYPNDRAPAGDAAACVNYLAGLGTTACRADGTVTMCRIGLARITGSGTRASSHCVDVARGAGRIMDVCTRSDGWVGGMHTANGNGGLTVMIKN